jgi:hypothetical protein
LTATRTRRTLPAMRRSSQIAWLGAVVVCASACPSPSPRPGAPSGTPEPTSSAEPADAGVAAQPPASASAAGPAEAIPAITVGQLVAEPKPGRYLLDAYVVELSPCPDCAPPIRCKPCVSDHVVVADEPDPPSTAARPPLRVTPDALGQFVVGTRYRLEIVAHPAVGGGRGINHVEVVRIQSSLPPAK